ncbi:MAG: D-glycero-beta-D-manno-heptose-7-phosphate kinase [Elusimicrobiota bacterium]
MKTNRNVFVERFDRAKVMVVGDLIVDRFVYGNVARISPEAPVPVVDVTKERYLPGGAGNVASNISVLGGKVYLFSVIGNDHAGSRIKTDLNSMKINTDGIIIDSTRPTTIKTRIIANHQQVVRYDRESRKEVPRDLYDEIFARAGKAIAGVDVVLLSDYGKGVLKPVFLKRIIELSKKYRKPVIVDPKVEHFLMYRKVASLTPNLQEAALGMGITRGITSENEIRELGQKIIRRLGCGSVIITLGERGMAIFEKNKKPVFVPTAAREVFDVTGAGDTVVATLALCLASGLPLRTSAEISNYAAGVVVGKLGTATVSKEELKSAICSR